MMQSDYAQPLNVGSDEMVRPTHRARGDEKRVRILPNDLVHQLPGWFHMNNLAVPRRCTKSALPAARCQQCPTRYAPPHTAHRTYISPMQDVGERENCLLSSLGICAFCRFCQPFVPPSTDRLGVGGSGGQVSMNDMAAMCMEIAASHGRKGAMPIKHIPGPEGVRGRNSNNDLIKQARPPAPPPPHSTPSRQGRGCPSVPASSLASMRAHARARTHIPSPARRRRVA